MLEIVIHWTYYKENVFFSSWNARQKKECVFFYDYDDFVGYIINHLDYSQLQKLRLALYQKYQKMIKFTPFTELNKDWEKFTWYNLQSPIISVDSSDFASVLPRDIRKKYFVWDSVREKFYFRSDFINYCKFHNV